MKNIIPIIVTAFLLLSCTNRKAENTFISAGTDSIQKDTSLEEVNRIFDNPFRDINNFDMKVGDEFIDDLHNRYSKTAELTITKNICVGDNCQSYQIFNNKDTNTLLYYFKGDSYEYGFSNDQYLLENDSLTFVRNFNVTIETWPTDNTETIWRVEETIYKFEAKDLRCTKKTALTKNLDRFDFTLKQVTSKIVKVGHDEKYPEKTEELKELLALKENEDLN